MNPLKPKQLSTIKFRFTEAAVEYSSTPQPLTICLSGSGYLDSQHRSLGAYLSQLQEEGYATGDEILSITWSDLYRLMAHPDHASSVPLLELPQTADLRPMLASQGALNDSDFSIFLEGWRTASGTPVRAQVGRNGATIMVDREIYLLPEQTWVLLEAVRDFARLPAYEKNRERNFREWGHIRALAVRANATLDNFLESTLVLTPEKLSINLRRNEVSSTPVVEVIPSFEEAPSWWLDVFDRQPNVPTRYDHTQDSGGILHIVIEPAVRSVLEQVKSMPGRRVAGAKAEAFLRNPYALLGEDATNTIPPEEFEASRTQAGIEFLTFRLDPLRKNGKLSSVDILIAPQGIELADTKRVPLATQTELQDFINAIEHKILADRLSFTWAEFELELGPSALAELEEARSLLAEWSKLRTMITSDAVYDLTGYAPRVEGIGQAKPVYSPYIARTGEKGAWIPDRVEVGIAFKPKDSDMTVLLPFGKEDQKAFDNAVAKAEAAGESAFRWPGLPTPISIQEAKALKSDIDLALSEIGTGKWKDDSFHAEHVPKGAPKGRPPCLLIPHNIELVGYSEQRDAALAFQEAAPRLPTSLNKESVRLLEHQNHGVAWLQHLWRNSPEYARGCLLADDMGLGKTLQLLTFLASAFEETPDLRPALIVAPVALLDNWQREIERFFLPNTFRVLTLYGSSLAARRVERAAIDQQLLNDGLTRFLIHEWIGNSNLVLTTYETLRDYSFSLAKEEWSVMVCDEAQKIKSPAALVTQAAKSMNARLKIAATGTPVENSLTDLWCLFDFIQPGLLGALNEFGRKYKRPIEARTDKERSALEELQALIAPQLLRRNKGEVARDLPPKHEDPGCRELPISTQQRRLYAEAIDAHQAKIMASDSRRVGQAILGMIHQLRTICAHPVPGGQVVNLSQPLHEAIQISPKLAWLLDKLDSIKSRQEKAIVFTELRDVQRLLQHYIGERFGFRPVIVNGDTDVQSSSGQSRQALIDAYQKSPGFSVIILSTMAVGFGLNIQAANHVIHYTRPWNPAKEDQATDRAYRIGQKKPVTVYYPTVHAHDFVTFEKRLDELLGTKRELAAKTWLNGADEISVTDFGDIQGIKGDSVLEDRPLGEEDICHIEGHALEVLCALIWDKLGYRTHNTPRSGDKGVDVVAIGESDNLIIQCKASSREGNALGWQAVRDVVAGEAAYVAQYPGTTFKKVAVTNQHFNQTAIEQASLHDVTLIDRSALIELLANYKITQQEFRLAVSI